MSPRLSELLLSSQSDERLVSLARAGHERAFVAIVERYRGELYALARRLCPDGRGEDVVQQAFLSAFAALRAGAEVEHLRGWLYRILRNAASRSQAPLCVPLDGATASADTVEDLVQQRALAMSALSELARLPERQRQAIVDTALGGMGRAEVASSMGLSEGAVRQLVHRARHTLRTAVTAVTPWPFARWFAAVGTGAPGSSELAAGAGAASSGGIVIKIGAVLASGTLVTGVAAVENHHGAPHPARPHASIAGRTQSAPRHAPLVPASVARTSLGGGDSSRPGTAASVVFASRTVSHAGAVAARTASHGVRHVSGSPGSGQPGAGEIGRGDHRGENGMGHTPVGNSGSGRSVGRSGGTGVAVSNGCGGQSGGRSDSGGRDGGGHHSDSGGGGDFAQPVGSIANTGPGDHHSDQPTGSQQLVSVSGDSSSGERSGSRDGSSFGSSGSANTETTGSSGGSLSGTGDGGRTSSH